MTGIRAIRRVDAEAQVDLSKVRRWHVDLTVTAASVLASSKAIRRRVIAGGTVTAGQPVYEDSADSFQAKAARANVAGTAKVAGIALHGASDNQPLEIVTDDPEFTPGATLAVGQTYALSSAVAGAIAPESDLAATNIVSLLMVAYSASQAVLDISNSGAVHA